MKSFYSIVEFWQIIKTEKLNILRVDSFNG